MDNDFGEHWFDNWEEKDTVWQDKTAEQLGYEYDKLMVINPDRFKDGRDGPCHSAALRRKFWTDVLTSLQISLSLMIEEARLFQSQKEELGKETFESEEYIEDLEDRIKALTQKYTHE